MHNSNRQWCLWGLAALMAMPFCWGCGAKVKGVFRDPELTPQRLRSDRMVIAGMAYALPAKKDTRQVRPALDSLLWLVASKEGGGEALEPPGYMRKILGDSDQSWMMDRFEKGESFSESQLARLAERFGDRPTNAIFGRVTRNELTTREVESTEGDEDKKTQYHTRRVAIDFIVYHFPEAEVVWKGEVSAWIMTEEQIDESFSLGAIIGSLLFGEDEPPGPTFESVLHKAYKKFLKELCSVSGR